MLHRESYKILLALSLLICGLCSAFRGQAQIVELLFPDLRVSPGDTACLDVRVNGFDSIAALQTTFAWDGTALDLISAESELSGLVFGAAEGGLLPVTWTDFSGQTVTLPDSSRLFRFCFVVVTGDFNEGSITLGDAPVATEVTKFDGLEFFRQTVIQSGGAFQVVPCEAVQLGRDTALCPGDRLMVNVTGLAQTYEWRRDGTVFFPANDSTAELQAGHTYSVQLQLSPSCRVSDTLRIDEIAPPSVQLGIDSSPEAFSCTGRSLSAFGTGIDSLVWQLDGELLGGGVNTEITPMAPGALQAVAVESRCGLADTSNTIRIVAPDTVRLNRSSCNPQDTGVVRQMLTNQYGCDSLVITTTSLSMADTVRQTQQSCNPQDTGMVINTFSNQFGCDSLVIITTELLPRDTVRQTFSTCHPQDTGSIITVLTNQYGCDSVVIQQTLLDKSGACGLLVDLQSSPPVCGGEMTGEVTVTITQGTGPFSLELLIGDNILRTGTISSTGNSFRFNALPAGNYRLRVSDATGGSFLSEVTVEEGNRPRLNLEAPPVGCNNTTTSIAVEAEGGLPPYLFSIDGGASFRTSNLFNDLGPGSYEVIAEDAGGCRSQTESLQIDLPTPLSVDLGPDRRLELGDSVRLSSQASRAIESVSWSPEEGLSCTSCPAPSAAPLENTRYRVTVVDEQGCEATDEILVRVSNARDGVYLPNAFSPNGDGVNDVYQVFPGRAIQQIFSLQIFDRWGNLLMDEKPENNNSLTWDGRLGREVMPSGVYLAVLKVGYVDGRQTTLTKEVNLVR